MNQFKVETQFIRPVTVFKRQRRTLLDTALKVGGLLGFLRLINSMLSIAHGYQLRKRLIEQGRPKVEEGEDFLINNQISRLD